MGEIQVAGRGALGLVQRLTCNDASRLGTGQAQYSALTTERGTFVDDILVYRRAETRFLLVVNAGNADRDFAWIAAHAEQDVEVTNDSSRFAQLALQGPRAEALMGACGSVDPGAIRYYHFVEGDVRGARAIVSRTGYTGEDGFEIYLPPDRAPDLFGDLLRAGRRLGLLPCGLGARDTLRLEARMLLYGSDIDETTTVLEAGLQGIVRLDKGDFLGREALAQQKSAGISRTLVGFELLDRGIARRGHAIREEGMEIGQVTSGTFSPTLRKSIGLAYVPPRLAAAGSRIAVAIRDRDVEAAVVPTPF